MNDRSSRSGDKAEPRPFGAGLEGGSGERRRPRPERRAAGRAPQGARRAQPPGTITRWRGYELSRFQIEAVAAIRGGHNVLVSAPTGAGKTLVAEYAIEDAVERGRRVHLHRADQGALEPEVPRLPRRSAASTSG